MTREEVWLRTWLTVAADMTTKEHKICTIWADAALAAFDERFPVQTEDEKETAQ